MAKQGNLEIILVGPERWMEVATLQRRCFPSPWDEDTVREVMANPTCRTLGAEDPGLRSLVAYALYAVQGELCHLLDLGVAPEWRRCRVGSRLVSFVAAAARGLGATKVFLEVRESNSIARSTYDQLGFTETGRRPRYYPDTGEDALVLQCNLPRGRPGSSPTPKAETRHG